MSPRSDGRRRAAGRRRPVRTAVIRPSGDVQGDARLDVGAEPGVFQPVRRGVACVRQLHASPSSTSASAVTPATQSSSAACFGRASARPRWGCVRTAWRSGRSPERIPGVVSGAGAEDGHGARVAAALPQDRARARRAGRAANSTTGVKDSRTTSRSTPSRVGVLAGGLLDRRRRRRPGSSWSAARESSQPRTREGMALTPFGSTAILPKVARAPASRASRRAASTVSAYVSIGSRRSVEPGGARVVGLAAEVEPPAAVRPDGGGDADRGRRTGRGRGPARRGVRRRRRCGRAVRGRGRWRRGRSRRASMACGRRDAVAVAQPVRLLGGQLPGGEPGADAGEPEAGALLVAEVDDGERPARTPLRCARSSSSAAKEETTPSGPSKAPPSGTESRCEPVTTASPGERGRRARPTGCRCGPPRRRARGPRPAPGTRPGSRRRRRSRRSGGSRRRRGRGRGAAAPPTSRGTRRRSRGAVRPSSALAHRHPHARARRRPLGAVVARRRRAG